eukprot:gene12007-14038_t
MPRQPDRSELDQLELEDHDDDGGSTEVHDDDDDGDHHVPRASLLPPLNVIDKAPMESMSIKQTIGPYVIGEMIGKGGFATVFKGLNTQSGDFVAIKRFEKTKISREQISNVMYMENGSLSSILNNFGTFPEVLASTYIEHVLKGLVYLHSEGIMHRDIKAANILINKVGDAKLADFNVAAELNESDKRYSVVGTPYWMAPEVIDISGHCQVSDIWSVGCTVIELLTGSPPYYNHNPMAAMFRIVQDDRPPLPKGISKKTFYVDAL